MGAPSLCFFDLGDVVAEFMPERRLPLLALLLQADESSVQELVWSSGLSAQFDSGSFGLVGMCSELSNRFGVSVKADDLSRVWCRAFEPSPMVLALARRVQEHTRVGLLTNNPPALEAGLPVYLSEIAERFDPVFFSCSLGAPKPLEAAFARVETLVGAAPQALALIDDSLRNVAAARARGWSAIHFVGVEPLRTELESLGWATG